MATIRPARRATRAPHQFRVVAHRSYPAHNRGYADPRVGRKTQQSFTHLRRIATKQPHAINTAANRIPAELSNCQRAIYVKCGQAAYYSLLTRRGNSTRPPMPANRSVAGSDILIRTAPGTESCPAKAAAAATPAADTMISKTAVATALKCSLPDFCCFLLNPVLL